MVCPVCVCVNVKRTSSRESKYHDGVVKVLVTSVKSQEPYTCCCSGGAVER